MKIGYLTNVYPSVSGTFIRREIHALEAMGIAVERYAVRRWDGALADPADVAEAGRTRYLLSGRTLSLFGAFVAEAATNPVGFLKALGTSARLISNAGGRIVPHAAYLMEACALRRLAARDGISHIHAHYATNPTAVALLCQRLGGPSYSMTVHGPDELMDPNANSTALKVAHAGFVAAITQFCRMTIALAAGMGQWNKIDIVRCGLDLAEFPANAPPPSGNTIVCVGRLCPQKGQVLIPRALSAVSERHPNARIVMVGDGETRAEIVAEAARLGMADRMEFIGWASNADVRAHIQNARALLLPSFAEGLPVVLMEAFALRRPVITTFVAGIPELVDRSCGWLIPAGDEEALAHALDACLSADVQTLAAMGREGRRRVEAAHDLHVNAGRLRDRFQSLEAAS